ncbi:RNA polymerase subunit sigma-24 [Polymorphobacter glacialis]|uniref:RNA polymerase subunit sigma-24 n=1 Tax=Sandarakinorhabdus glacialis TaxID=1614636 RepID=A0A917E9K6_9SPHN|nr:sigma-70 family RNA polymerase sigma factor [Polymorphobacter glacialis]GGE14116.1 RNA polymerase subunit sigma-24 [Polymorphobacter glacialis]
METGGLEAIFLANRARLLRFLRAHGAGDAAEDLLQELWFKLSRVDTGPVAQPLAYLYRAANNLMLDRYRSVRQTERREQDWVEASDAPVSGLVVISPGETRLIAREQLLAVEAELQLLGDRTATIFRRHRLDGIPQRDIAAELGVSLSTVESDLRRAYRAMIELRGRFDEV